MNYKEIGENMLKKVVGKTISDFGEQWTHYTENTGFYASVKALEELLSPLMDMKKIQGKNIADVGAGTGRYTHMLHAAQAKSILAMEPSKAFRILKQNTDLLDNVVCMQTKAEEIPAQNFDLIFCIGVLQFIPEPRNALKAMGKALHSSGSLFLWVYGAENNRLYLSCIKLLRFFTCNVSHRILDFLANCFEKLACIYASFCKILPLPLADYMNGYYSRLDQYSRKLVIYDQLNPKDVTYYYKKELKELLEECGYTDIQMHHRLNYSWSVLARYKGGKK